MAFQQQQRPQPPRQLAVPHNATDAVVVPAPRKRAIEESQEWILFSPVRDEDASVTATHTSRTPRTATHPSDFGSLETHVRSQPQNSNDSSGIHIDDISEDGDDYDAEELDSLDDGLHAFHHPFSTSSHPHIDASGGTVLPTHDGFGTFPSEAGLQEQLWQFERYNPQRRAGRHGQRRGSARRGVEGAEDDRLQSLGIIDAEDDRTARIEKWRLDQSRALLEEIERETRRMRRRAARLGSAANSKEMRALNALSKTVEAEEAAKQASPPSESFWRRITRRVIRDLIGLDESTLSVLFGESFVPGEEETQSRMRTAQDDDRAGTTPTQSSPLGDAADVARGNDQSWEMKLLATIARELGSLVHQFSDHNTEGAFSTYRRMQNMPIEYAGLPVPRDQSLRSRRLQELHAQRDGAEPSFAPTVPQMILTPSVECGDSSLWGIEEEPAEVESEAQERQYWEQEVDIKMVFSYLKKRFSPQSSSPPPSATTRPTPTGPLPASWATNNSSESMRRAEIIRRHHPLVSRAAKRDSMLRRHHVLQRRAVIGGGITGGGSSSCASQSTKRSRTGSSRHYWGSASGRGSGGALGGWGEV